MNRYLIAVITVVVLVIGLIFFHDFKGMDLKMGGKDVAVKVSFSVIRYNDNIISSRLIVDGTGTLQTRHRIKKEDVGLAFYEEAEIIERLQSYSTNRYMIDEGSFKCETIVKEIELE
jgi:hypothetical protein